MVKGKTKPAKAFKVIIDDIDEADVKEAIAVKRGQTFSIENLSPSLSHSVVVSFHNGDNWVKAVDSLILVIFITDKITQYSNIQSNEQILLIFD